MKKPKVFLKNPNTLKAPYGNEQKVALETSMAVERIKNGNPAFNCKKCGCLFTPESTQWIFYLLCDDCFAKFDLQKMMGRLAYLRNEKRVLYFEDSDEWIKAKTN